MKIQHWLRITMTCFLLCTLAACTTHKKMPNVNGMYDANGRHGTSTETYTEGARGNMSDECARNSKCRPGRPVPGAEQHYFFDFDSSDVRQDALSSIEMQANYLMKHPNKKIRLEGNTDDVGSREYNIALGERRARAVLAVLKQYGVNQSQVTVVSFGAEKPAVGGEDESARQCNRRVDLIYSAD